MHYKKIAVVYNPLKSKKKLHTFIQHVKKEFPSVEVQVFTTLSSDDVVKKTQEAIRNNCDLLVCAGGDGTLYGVVNGSMDHEIPVLLLPLGTSNDLAKQMEIHSVVDSAQAIRKNQLEYIDLGECAFQNSSGQTQTSYFTSSAGTGLFADLFYLETNKVIILLRKLIKELVYPPITIWKLARERELNRYEVVLDNKSINLSSITFLEISKLKVIGGLNLTYLAQHNNQLFDVLFMEPKSIWSDVKLVFYAFLSRTKFHSSPQIHYYSGEKDPIKEKPTQQIKTVKVNTEKKTFLHLNGEWVGYTPAQFSIASKRLPILTMKSQPQAQ